MAIYKKNYGYVDYADFHQFEKSQNMKAFTKKILKIPQKCVSVKGSKKAKIRLSLTSLNLLNFQTKK